MDPRAGHPAQRDEQRIARRVRLMLGDVEVMETEREVDRIEIFERCGQKRHVQNEENQRERIQS